MPVAQSGSWEIYWEERGPKDAPPLLLIIGLSHRIEHWGPLADLLERELRLLLFDPRNIGRSAKLDVPYSLAEEAADVAAVLDAAGVERAWVYGRSRGGMLAQEFALQHPRRVRGLILEATTDNGPESAGASERVRAALAIEPNLTREEIFRRQDEAMAAPGWPSRDPEGYARLLAVDLEAPPRRFAVLRQQEALASWSSHGRLGGIRCPTLVLCGEEDEMVPPANSRHLAEEIPGAELVLLPGMGHLGMWERPAELAAIITRFIREHEAAEPDN